MHRDRPQFQAGTPSNRNYYDLMSIDELNHIPNDDANKKFTPGKKPRNSLSTSHQKSFPRNANINVRITVKKAIGRAIKIAADAFLQNPLSLNQDAAAEATYPTTMIHTHKWPICLPTRACNTKNVKIKMKIETIPRYFFNENSLPRLL
jgi:hypothetical protein